MVLELITKHQFNFLLCTFLKKFIFCYHYSCTTITDTIGNVASKRAKPEGLGSIYLCSAESIFSYKYQHAPIKYLCSSLN